MAERTQCGINIDPSNAHGRPSVKDLQGLGATWVRFVLKVNGASPEALESAFRSEIYQQYTTALREGGIQILMILNNETVPDWPTHTPDANAPAWKEYLYRYEDRCRRIANHYQGQVAAFQIWNEPDFAAPRPDYDPTIPPGVFGQMLKRSYTAIKDVSADLRVITGGLVSGNAVWLEWVKGATENRLYADAIAVHPYGQRPAPDWPWPSWGFGTLKGLLQEYYKRSQPVPIWISELGTDDLNCQGGFPERAYDTLSRGMGRVVPVAFWFCWSDGMVSPFGLRDEGGKAKEAYRSYQKYAQSPANAPISPTFQPDAAAVMRSRLHGSLVRAAARYRVMTLDTDNPLQNAILADGFVPNSAEFGVEQNGIHYRVQRAADPHTGKLRMYYARGPVGNPITFVEQEVTS
jgi:hypothetical protein